MSANSVVKLLQYKFKHTDVLDKAYAVGGYVRDLLMNNNPKDLDIVVEQNHGSLKLALQIHRAFKTQTTQPYRLGNYPIWSIQFTKNIIIDNLVFDVANETIEIAETMSEEFPNKFSRQRITRYATLNEDVFRRDFTINSILMKLSDNTVVDFVNGKSDINNHIIKCNPSVNPVEIFNSDPLRILRGIRFSVRFNWKIEEQTFNAMKVCSNRIEIISNERIINELKNICKYKNGLYNSILLMDKLNILNIIFPEVAKLKTIMQAPEIRLFHLEGSEFTCKNFYK